LECGHHPTSWESRVGWQDADIMHSTPRFLGGWSQTSRTPYSNMFAEGLDLESFYKLAWLTWNEVNNSTNAVHCWKGMILVCCKVFKKNQQFFLTRFFALWFCRSLNSRIIMIVACTCSIMWSCSLRIPQSTSTSPLAKVCLIVYVFPFCFVSFWHCSKLVRLQIVYNFCFVVCSWPDLGSPLLKFMEKGKQSKNYYSTFNMLLEW
jgi:hypothetical protein